MNEFADILQCPVSGGALKWGAEGQLLGADGSSYQYSDGVVRLLSPDEAGFQDDQDSARVLQYYDSVGWSQDETGIFGDTKAFTDTRSMSVRFSDRCIDRLGQHFTKGGKYLLDAGCGSIPHERVLHYGDEFDQRICVDISVQGLMSARRKLGERGAYIQGSLTNLPLKSNSMDAITCNHVIYQIPAEFQKAAFLELWRVLKPGGVAIIVYVWPHAPFDRRAATLAKYLFGMTPSYPAAQDEANQRVFELPHNALPESWFESQDWPFEYEIETFRTVSQSFLKHHVTENHRGRAFLNTLYLLPPFLR